MLSFVSSGFAFSGFFGVSIISSIFILLWRSSPFSSQNTRKILIFELYSFISTLSVTLPSVLIIEIISPTLGNVSVPLSDFSFLSSFVSSGFFLYFSSFSPSFFLSFFSLIFTNFPLKYL